MKPLGVICGPPGLRPWARSSGNFHPKTLTFVLLHVGVHGLMCCCVFHFRAIVLWQCFMLSHKYICTYIYTCMLNNCRETSFLSSILLSKLRKYDSFIRTYYFQRKCFGIWFLLSGILFWGTKLFICFGSKIFSFGNMTCSEKVIYLLRK